MTFLLRLSSTSVFLGIQTWRMKKTWFNLLFYRAYKQWYEITFMILYQNVCEQTVRKTICQPCHHTATWEQAVCDLWPQSCHTTPLYRRFAGTGHCWSRLFVPGEQSAEMACRQSTWQLSRTLGDRLRKYLYHRICYCLFV